MVLKTVNIVSNYVKLCAFALILHGFVQNFGKSPKNVRIQLVKYCTIPKFGDSHCIFIVHAIFQVKIPEFWYFPGFKKPAQEISKILRIAPIKSPFCSNITLECADSAENPKILEKVSPVNRSIFHKKSHMTRGRNL